jgi:hypothetical protein
MRDDRSVGRVSLALAAIALAVVASPAATAASPGTGAASRGAAAARVLDVHDEGHLRFLTSSGSELIDEGPATGTVPGKVRVHFIYNGDPAVTARFEIYGHGGSISGRANARLSNPTSPDPSFRGAFSITDGSGRYAHIHGTGELFGVFTRRGYAMVVQTIGKLPY